MENKEMVGADSISAQEETTREHMECSPTDLTESACEPIETDTIDASQESHCAPHYVDLTKDEFIAFRMLTARIIGPLRQRIPSLVVSILCFFALGGYAVYEWMQKNFTGYPDPVLVVGALLVLIPALIICVYVPLNIKKQAARQYDRSVQAGIDFCGELVVYPDCVEKIGQTVTAHVRLDERALFIETADMMVLLAQGSPAIVLPARCLTEGVARQVRQAADRLPLHNRRFIARVIPGGQVVGKPAPVQKPEEKWVSTFTYTAEEYTTVLRGLIQQHFWKMSPLLAGVAMMISAAFGGFETENPLRSIVYFVLSIAVLMLFNLVLPLNRAKAQAEQLSPHDLTMQVRIDTTKLLVKLPKGGENWVLWCDVEHVYDRDDFVEIVHNKRSSLFIPKRVIEDLDALDAVIQQCRGKQKV